MDTFRRVLGPAGAIAAIVGGGMLFVAPGRETLAWVAIVAGAAAVGVALYFNRQEIVPVLRGRPLRYGANSVFYALVVLASLALVNLLASRHVQRIDMTEAGIHSLSPQTRRVLDGLDRTVTVVAFYLPGEGRQAEDLLRAYRNHSSRIEYRILDPARYPAEARAYEIESLPTILVSTDTGKARPLTPSSFEPLDEQMLTNALIEATTGARPVVCLTTGHGEPGIDDGDPGGLREAVEALRKENSETREVRLLGGDAPLEGCASLIVAGPTHALLDVEADQIGTWLEAGGKMLVLREPRTTTGLEPLLAMWGIKPNDDLVVDVNPISRIMGGSPSMPVVYDYTTHPIVRDFQGLATIYPTVGSVETVTPSLDGVSDQALARTSEKSWGETGALTGSVSFDDEDRAGPLDIAAAASRRVPAAPSNPDATRGEGGGADETPGVRPADPASNGDPNAEAAAPVRESRLVFFGDSDFITNSAFMLGGNRDLFLNTLAWLNERTDLVSIPPKSRKFQPLTLTQRDWIVLLIYGLALLPILLLTEGVFVFLKRRRL